MPAETRSTSLGTKISIGVAAGIVVGVLLGDLARPFELVGEIYVGLLQMTVLPYVTVALIVSIGGLRLDQAKRFGSRAAVVISALWALTLATIFLLPFSLPEWRAGSFFSASLVDSPPELDFIHLYLPVNPFHALANNIVPASVLFSIATGAALIGIDRKVRLLEPLAVFTQALSDISGFVLRLSPYGTFALTAGAAGTLDLAQLMRLVGYVSTFTVGVALLTFVVFPGLVVALTPFRYRELLAGFKEAGLTAFATGKLFAVLPIVIESAKELLVGEGVEEHDADATANVFVPLGYPFPNAGRLLATLFIPFAAWYSGTPLEIGDYPALLALGFLSFFGSPVAAIPFLLDQFRLASDLLPLFLIAGVWCSRLGDLLGAMHLTAFTLLCAAWNEGRVAIAATRVGRWIAVSALVAVVCLVVNHLVVKEVLRGQEPTMDLVARMELLDDLVPIEVVDPVPNPVALHAGEDRADRIKRSEVLRVGYVPDNPPFCYTNGQGDVVGLDIDLVQDLAAALKVDLCLVPYSPGGAAAALQADHFDIAVGGILSGIDNLERVVESSSYLLLHAALVVPDHRVREFSSMEKIRANPQIRVGVSVGSRVSKIQRNHFPNVERVSLPDDQTFLTGKADDVDALLTTAEQGAVLTMLYPAFSVVVPEGSSWRMPVVVNMPADSPTLLRIVNAWIQLQIDNGSIEELSAHWIQGERILATNRRWSVVQDVFGWFE